MESERFVACECTQHVGIVTLQHEKRRNALSAALVAQLVDALAELRAQQARVAILRAAPGAAVFSAGHDVGELPLDGRDPLGWDDPLRHLVREIETFPAPVIAMVEGGVWGGACEMVLACDLVVAAPGATFAVTPARLGVPYNVSGMLTFLNAADLRIVKEMIFTARPVGAERAERLGMINPSEGVIPMVVSTDRPWSIAQIDAPTPRWQEMISSSPSGRLTTSAAFNET